MTSFSNRE